MTRAHRNAFDRIAVGAQPESSARTLDRLVEAGLLERRKVTLTAADRFGPVYRYDYSVPISVHISWCEWMTRPKRREKRKPLPPQRPVEELPLFGTAGSINED
jgi:hypothetical protein